MDNHKNNMKDWNELKDILDEQGVVGGDQQLVRDFLISFDFQKRQQLMGILIGWPEKARLFTDLVKKKKALAENYDANLARDILDLEDKEINDLIKNI